MKVLFAVLFWGLYFFPLQAQVQKFGDISRADLEMEVYDLDSSASAVVLFEVGESELNYTTVFKNELEQHERIKILSDEGLDQADITIRFRHEDPVERIRDLKAQSYYLDENGEILEVKLDKKDIYVEEVSKNYSVMKFSIPGAKKGGIIEYSYRLSSNSPLNFPDWYFQREIPVKWSQYTARVPEYIKFLTLTRGYHNYYTQENKPYNDNLMGEGEEHFYVMKDVPAVKNEPYMNARGDYLAHVKYILNTIELPRRMPNQILKTWNEIIENLLSSKSYGKKLKGSKTIKLAVNNAIENASDSDTEKVIAIYNYVKENIDWNKRFGIYLRENLDEVLESKSGNGSSINMLLVQMFREAGLESHPVLVNTRSNGEVIGMFPFTSAFNHTIAYVAADGQYFLLDAKNKQRSYNLLPQNIIGTNGLLVYGNEMIWLPVENIQKNSRFVNWNVNMHDGGFDANGSAQETGYFSLQLRDDLSGDESDKKAMHERFFEGYESLNIDSVNITENDPEGAIKYTMNISLENNYGSNVVYFNPMIHSRLSKNPFSLEKRTFPVDYNYTFDENMVMTITIPENWQVDELPTPVLYRLPGRAGEFRRIIKAEGNTITLNYRFKIDKMRFMPEEYEVLKGMYDQMVVSLNENIVFTKL